MSLSGGAWTRGLRFTRPFRSPLRRYSVAGDPVSLALTPDGSQLWVGGLTSGIITLQDTATYNVAGTINVGDGGANSGDGNEPTSIVMTTIPTPGGS